MYVCLAWISTTSKRMLTTISVFFCCTTHEGLTSLCLDGGTLAVGLAINILTGYSTISVMLNPLSECSSPSDFWGRRWNRMIHGTLKVRTLHTHPIHRICFCAIVSKRLHAARSLPSASTTLFTINFRGGDFYRFRSAARVCPLHNISQR